MAEVMTEKSKLSKLISALREQQAVYNAQYVDYAGVNEAYNCAIECMLKADDMKQSAYEVGLIDAWQLAKKIITADYTSAEMNEIFGDDFYYNKLSLFSLYSAKEALLKVKEYEKEQKEEAVTIRVGDEVYRDDEPNKKYIITKIVDEHYANVIWGDGSVGYIDPTKYRKTGRRFPHMNDLLNQLKEEE